MQYDRDLAYIHDSGYGGFARRSAPGLLKLLAEADIASGRVVDLGCGSGIWAQALAAAGYQVLGVDQSAAMIEIARRRVPEARFQVASLYDFAVPPCGAVTALGEVLNYLFDPQASLAAIERLGRAAFGALQPGGLLIFDLAEPGRCRGQQRTFSEGPDWACLVEYEYDDAAQRLTRRIVSFRQTGETWRRQEETHCQKLYDAQAIAEILRGIGFRVALARHFGEYALPESIAGVVARKPKDAA